MSSTFWRDRRPGERPVIYGRERERAQLRELLDATIDGHGSLVLVSGEAGIGKTTLVRDLIYEAESRDCLVLAGGCYDLTVTPPYGPWAEAIRSYRPNERQPEVPGWFGNLDELEKIGSQTAIFEKARQFFASIAEPQPLLIVLEDLHWADPASVDALRYLARTLGNVPVLILATYRDDEPGADHSFFEALPALVRESQLERIAVRRWNKAETYELISSRYRWRPADAEHLTVHTYRLAEGNPFYTVELLRELESDGTLRPHADGWSLGDLDQTQIPRLVRQVVEQRLRRLSNEARLLLEFAAVIGHSVPFDLWQEMSEVGESELAAVVEATLATQLIDETRDRIGIQFRHALVRKTLYEGMNPFTLRRLHRKAADTLINQTLQDPDSIAFHLDRADDVRAGKWLVRAGWRAQRASAWASAADRYIAAEAHLAGDPRWGRIRAWLLFSAGTLVRYNENRRSIELIERARVAAIEAGDEHLKAFIMAHDGFSLCHQGNLGEGVARMEEAVAILDRLPSAGNFFWDEDMAEALIRSFLDGDPTIEESGAVQTEGSDKTQSFGYRRVLSHWLSEVGRFEEAVQMSDSLDSAFRCVSASKSPIASWIAEPHPGLAIAYSMLGAPDKAWDLEERGSPATEAMGDYFHAAAIRFTQLHNIALPYYTDSLQRRDQLATQIECLAAGVERQTGMESFQVLAQSVLDDLEGRWDRIRAQENVLENLTFSPLKHTMIVLLGELDRRQGLRESARQRVQAVLPWGPATEVGASLSVSAIAAQRLMINLALDENDLETAYAWLCLHDHWLGWSGAVLGQAQGQLLWAQYFLSMGSRSEARRRAQKSLEYAAGPRQPLALIETHRFLGRLDTEEHAFDVAAEHLDRSMILAQACRAAYAIALAHLAQAELMLAMRQPEQAAPLLDQGKDTFKRLNARPAIERLALTATKLATTCQSYPADLSPREVEVLSLIAEGLSNPEIARQLYISRRTVERHVSAILRKTDSTNRTEAARFAIDHQIA